MNLSNIILIMRPSHFFARFSTRCYFSNRFSCDKLITLQIKLTRLAPWYKMALVNNDNPLLKDEKMETIIVYPMFNIVVLKETSKLGYKEHGKI